MLRFVIENIKSQPIPWTMMPNKEKESIAIKEKLNQLFQMKELLVKSVTSILKNKISFLVET